MSHTDALYQSEEIDPELALDQIVGYDSLVVRWYFQ